MQHHLHKFLFSLLFLLPPLGACDLDVEIGVSAGTGEPEPEPEPTTGGQTEGADDESGADTNDACSEINIQELGNVSLACADEMFDPCASLNFFGNALSCQHIPYRSAGFQGYTDMEERIPSPTARLMQWEEDLASLNGGDFHITPIETQWKRGWVNLHSYAVSDVAEPPPDSDVLLQGDVLYAWILVSEVPCNEWNMSAQSSVDGSFLPQLDAYENSLYPGVTNLVAAFDIAGLGVLPSVSITVETECDVYAHVHPHQESLADMIGNPLGDKFISAIEADLTSRHVFSNQTDPYTDASLAGGVAVLDLP